MQQEDDLRGLAKIREFMLAVSIIIVTIHIYVFCHETAIRIGLDSEIADDILSNFQRTTGIFGNPLTTKVFAAILLAISCMGVQGVKNENIS